MKFSGYAVLGCLFGCIIPTWAQSQDPPKIEPDSPDFTVGPSIMPKGHLQTETRITAERRGPSHQYGFGETLVRYGVSKRAEVRVGIPSYLSVREQGRTTGLDDASLEAKFKLLEGEKRGLGLYVDTLLPTGSRRVAERRYQPSFRLAPNFKLGDNLELTLNVGARRASESQQRFTQTIATAELNYEINPRNELYTEIYGFNRLEAGGHSQKFVAAGLIHLLNGQTALDVRIGSGLGNHIGGPDYFYGFGFSRLF